MKNESSPGLEAMGLHVLKLNHKRRQPRQTHCQALKRRRKKKEESAKKDTSIAISKLPFTHAQYVKYYLRELRSSHLRHGGSMKSRKYTCV